MGIGIGYGSSISSISVESLRTQKEIEAFAAEIDCGRISRELMETMYFAGIPADMAKLVIEECKLFDRTFWDDSQTLVVKYFQGRLLPGSPEREAVMDALYNAVASKTGSMEPPKNLPTINRWIRQYHKATT